MPWTPRDGSPARRAISWRSALPSVSPPGSSARLAGSLGCGPTSTDLRDVPVVYLDSSALVKLVVLEPESRPLRAYLRREPRRISCGLARTEVLRAVRPAGPAALELARRLLRSVDLIRLDDALLDAAGMLEPVGLRSLDAVHLAAAQLVAPALRAVVTYDRRLAGAATSLGFAVAAPR